MLESSLANLGFDSSDCNVTACLAMHMDDSNVTLPMGYRHNFPYLHHIVTHRNHCSQKTVGQQLLLH